MYVFNKKTDLNKTVFSVKKCEINNFYIKHLYIFTEKLF